MQLKVQIISYDVLIAHLFFLSRLKKIISYRFLLIPKINIPYPSVIHQIFVQKTNAREIITSSWYYCKKVQTNVPALKLITRIQLLCKDFKSLQALLKEF